MPELSVARVRAVLGSGGWRVSGPVGSMGRTRVARRAGRAVVVKLTDVPRAVVRLAELGVTPPVLDAGDGWLVQEYVEGPHPDHAWFTAHLAAWADLVARYLHDAELAALVDAAPGRERLAVGTAAELFGAEPGAGWPEGCARSFAAWRAQAREIAAYPALPVHPDAHRENYVVAGGRLYLLDWDGIDRSDVVRDVGVQVWGFLARERWDGFLGRVGLRPSGELAAAVCWWSAFKMLRTALWVDDGAFHARLFEHAVARRPWHD